jgi:hypothetical protein
MAVAKTSSREERAGLLAAMGFRPPPSGQQQQTGVFDDGVFRAGSRPPNNGFAGGSSRGNQGYNRTYEFWR